jgi:glycosyltransferase involved in cell wall biosynthesis
VRAPRVSVVIPVFNAAPTLPCSIGSIGAQTFRDWELIAVDDGSTDGSAAWLEELARREPRLRLVRQTHDGIVAALNAGLAVARGEFIARMDADDESFPDRLAGQTAFLDARPEIGVVGSLVEYGGDRAANEGYALHVDWLNTLTSPESIALNRFVESPFAHPSVMFRRELIARHGGYREGDFPEDYELWLRWLEAGVRMAKTPESLLRWNDPPGRLSRTHPRYEPEAFYRLKAGFLARWLERNVDRRRPLLVWGAGRPTRKRVRWLEACGVDIDGFVDVDPRKTGRALGGRRVRAPGEIPAPPGAFVVGYVANRGARDGQREFLQQRGFVEGRDFIFAA